MAPHDLKLEAVDLMGMNNGEDEGPLNTVFTFARSDS